MADLIAMPERCTCAEVHGEDPNCALHGVATEWALENILPRDWQEMVLEQAAELEKLAPLAISLQATAEAAAHSASELTALRERVAELEAQLANRSETNDEGLLPCPKCKSVDGPHLYWWTRGQAWLSLCEDCNHESSAREAHEFRARDVWNGEARAILCQEGGS